MGGDASKIGDPGLPGSVQLYEVARTAHLERILGEEGLTLLYRQKRYDFDEQVADGVRIERAGLLRTVWYAATHAVGLVEVNEPLVTRASLRSLLFISTAKLRAIVLRAPRPIVVAYAIANVPTAMLRANLPWKARLKLEAQRPLANLVMKSLDRIAFGSADAQSVYLSEFGDRFGAVSQLIEALPVAVDLSEGSATVRPPVVLFLGDLSTRKGFPDVVDAWDQVRGAVPDARFVIVGRGEGVGRARDLADADPRVSLDVAPPREVILGHLRQAKVVVLPSRRRPLWREQIGLPLVEGLAHGCIVVTTDETGIAEWLRSHGHHVLPETEVTDNLASAITEALTSDVTPSEVQSALPEHDGRDAAREWLYGRGA